MFLNFNGEVREEGAVLLRPDNRGFRYGDGLFETMLVREGKVRLGRYHLERLGVGMRLLRLEFPRPFILEMLEGLIDELCAGNGLVGAPARARLTVFRGGPGLYNGLDREAWYCLQVGGLTAGGARADGLAPDRFPDGLALDVFPDGRKVCDGYSGIKSNNYQLSTLAGMYAAERGLDDCLLLNSNGRVAETTMANIWWVRDNRIYTPPLSEGCVAGVMRRFLLEALPAAGYEVFEKPTGLEELAMADEMFISNAIRGVQWVRELSGRHYGRVVSTAINDKIIRKI